MNWAAPPWSQNLSDKSPIDQHGREHQPESFCAWMAGGGVKPGLTYGDTDDMGYRVVNGKIHGHETLVYSHAQRPCAESGEKAE